MPISECKLRRGDQDFQGIMPSPVLALALSAFLIWPTQAVGQVENSVPNPSADEETAADTIVVTGRNFAPLESVGSAKLSLPIAETPQTITAISSELFQDLGYNTYVDALNLAPGVQKLGDFGSDLAVISRGYSLGGVKVNGLLADRTKYDNIAVESIDIVKGAAGVTFGDGGPGGVINIITKRPDRGFSFGGQATLGSFDFKRIQGQLSTPIGQSQRVRVLVTGAVEDADSYSRFAGHRSAALYGVVDAELSNNLSLMASAYWNRYRDAPLNSGTPGVVTYADEEETEIASIRFPDELPLDFFLGATWSSSVLENQTYSAALNYKPSKEFRLEAVVGYVASDIRAKVADVCCEVSSDLLTQSYAVGYERNTRAFNTELRASGEVPVLSGDIKYLTTAEYKLTKARSPSTEYLLVEDNYNILIPNELTDPFPGKIAQYYRSDGRNRTEIFSGSGTLIISPTRELSATLGARYDKYKVRVTGFGDGDLINPTSINAFNGNRWSFKGALMYEIAKGIRPYYSFGQTFVINPGRTCQNEALPPETGRVHELGVKVQVNPRLLWSTAVYNIKSKGNLVTLAPDTCPEINVDPTGPGEGKSSKGFETELIGKLARTWNIILGYSYNKAIERFDGQSFDVAGAKPHQVSLYTIYDFPDGALAGFGLGGGFTYTTGYAATVAPVLRLNSDFRADASLYYRISPVASMSLNVRNMFNARDQFSAFQVAFFQNLYQSPREFKISANVEF